MTEVTGSLLTEKETAEILRKSHQTLRRWRRIGYGPSFTFVGRTPLYPASWVNDWLKVQAA